MKFFRFVIIEANLMMVVFGMSHYMTIYDYSPHYTDGTGQYIGEKDGDTYEVVDSYVSSFFCCLLDSNCFQGIMKEHGVLHDTLNFRATIVTTNLRFFLGDAFYSRFEA